MRKNLISVLMLICIAIGVCFLIINWPSASAPNNRTAGQVYMIMSTGGPAGTYHPYGGVLSDIIDDVTGYIKIEARPSGASVENLLNIYNGESQLAIVQNDTLDYAYYGTNTWTDPPVKNAATLMTLFPEVIQVVVTVDSGIKSINDLRGRRISTGLAGSGVEVNARQILEIHGLTIDDLQAQHLSHADAAEAIKTDNLDGFFITSPIPNIAALELSLSCHIRVINLDEDKRDALIAKYPFYTKITISDRDYSYSFVPEYIDTVAVKGTLIASSHVDEQVAYNIVKSIIENKESIMALSPRGVYIEPSYAVQGVSVDFHPGARRYFQEIGAL